MDYRITGLSSQPYQHLFGQSDTALRAKNIIRYQVDTDPGFPDRIEMRDGRIGESMLLLNYTHLPGTSPYRASHAIFVREGATRQFDEVNVIPEVLLRRPISLRAFDSENMIVAAEITEGEALSKALQQLLALPRLSYIHAHYAKPGCYAGLIRPI